MFQGLDGPLLRAVGETEHQEKPERGHKYYLRNLDDFTISRNVPARYNLRKCTCLLVVRYIRDGRDNLCSLEYSKECCSSHNSSCWDILEHHCHQIKNRSHISHLLIKNRLCKVTMMQLEWFSQLRTPPPLSPLKKNHTKNNNNK